MRIFWDNKVDAAATVITAASESADLPVSNISHPDRKKVYRTGTSAAAEWIKFNLGSALAIRELILLDHTLTAGDTTIKLQGNASDSWGSPSVNEDLTFNADVMEKWLSAAQTYQWWRIIFTKSAAGETRDIGRVFLGPGYECNKGPAQPDGLTITPMDLSVTDRALDGTTHSEIKSQYDHIAIDFPPISDAQMDQLKALAADCGTHTPFFVSIEPTLKQYDLLYYVKAKSLKARKVKLWGSGIIRWDVSMELNEEL